MTALVQYASRLDLPRTESQVHTILASYLYSDRRTGRYKDFCFPSHREIARAAKLSKSAVRQAIYRLRKKGIWMVQSRFRKDPRSGEMSQTSNKYIAGPWLTLWEAMRKNTRKLSTGKSNREGVTQPTPKNLEKEKNKQKRENSPSEAACARRAPPPTTQDPVKSDPQYAEYVNRQLQEMLDLQASRKK